MKQETFEKITVFNPAFDKRNSYPAKDYGIHSVQCLMVLKGKNGATHFTFSTGMFLPETMQEYARSGRLTPLNTFDDHWFILNSPMGYDIGYHSPTPMYEGQEVSRSKCEWIGLPCYCDGSTLRAEEVMNTLLREGSDAVWKILESDYEGLKT